MNIQTGDEDGVADTAPTNFTVVRVKRDILRRSSDRRDGHQPLGVDGRARDSNQAYGVDAAFSFFQNVNLGGYYARTETDGLQATTTTAIRAASTTPAIATARRRST